MRKYAKRRLRCQICNRVHLLRFLVAYHKRLLKAHKARRPA